MKHLGLIQQFWECQQQRSTHHCFSLNFSSFSEGSIGIVFLFFPAFHNYQPTPMQGHSKIYTIALYLSLIQHAGTYVTHLWLPIPQIEFLLEFSCSSTLHMVKKKESFWLLCGDYYCLNTVTFPDNYHLPVNLDFFHFSYHLNSFGF